MGGFFGVVSEEDCVADVFYGTDYHSHLGNQCGGMLIQGPNGFCRNIHKLRHDQFRSKFENDLDRMHGNFGIGCISDTEDQPLITRCKFGCFGITTVGHVANLDELRDEALRKENAHFSEIHGNDVNPTELVASLIGHCDDFAEGIRNAQERIQGSCSMLILSSEGIYAARDRWGRTPIVVGRKDGSYAAAFESCALHNLGYRVCRWLGPGETVLMTPGGLQDILPPRREMRMCAFLWIYYGFPASCYEEINVEQARYRCGAMLARRDRGMTDVDAVVGIPDSGTAHALGYAGEARLPYKRSYVKYTPTWARSFISDSQTLRRYVAKMKLIPISDFIKGQRLLFCEDSIVRGTQLRDTFARLPELGAAAVHVRSACPPIMYGCKYLNFSPSRTPMELVARRAVDQLEGSCDAHLDEYADAATERHRRMVECIRRQMGFTSLKYQTLDDMIEAIGFPREKLCTYCWDGRE